ncbi:hypothetical protein DFH27DRAFT_605833 [Peziza echinospora]|nr:hypothetical protein DFH27DRAFT_605833 [Peziza echinospora]
MGHVRAILLSSAAIPAAATERIHQLACAFVKGAQNLYYQHKPKRSTIMDSNVHALLHLADAIRDMGPGWVTWAAPIERYCGTLAGMARSKSHLKESLANAVRLEDQLHHAGFARGELAKKLHEIIRPPSLYNIFNPIEENVPVPAHSLAIPGLQYAYYIHAGVPKQLPRRYCQQLLFYMRNFYNLLGIGLKELPGMYVQYNKFRRFCVNDNHTIGSKYHNKRRIADASDEDNEMAENFPTSDLSREKSFIQYREMFGGFGCYEEINSLDGQNPKVLGPGEQSKRDYREELMEFVHPTSEMNVGEEGQEKWDEYGRQVMSGSAGNSRYPTSWKCKLLSFVTAVFWEFPRLQQ